MTYQEVLTKKVIRLKLIYGLKKSFFLTLLFTGLLFSQTEKLNGNVKSVTEKVIFSNDSIQNYKLFTIDGDYGHSGFSSPKATKKRFFQNWFNEPHVHYLNTKQNYNNKGLVVNEDWFYKNDEKFVSYEYEYTDFDSLSKTTTKNSNNPDFKVSVLSYDYSKNIQSELNYSTISTEYYYLKIYTYDNFRLIKEELLGKSGNQFTKYYNYNKAGLQNKIIIHKPTVFKKNKNNSYSEVNDSIGTYYTATIKKYNNKKQLTEELKYEPPTYSSKNVLDSKTLYSYDERGNCIEKKRIPINSNMAFIISKKFDDKNRISKEVEKTINFDNPRDFEKEYIYDNDELVKLIIKYPKSTCTIEFKYKYDEFNNWIELSKYVNGEKLFIWKRTIEYENTN